MLNFVWGGVSQIFSMIANFYSEKDYYNFAYCYFGTL